MPSYLAAVKADLEELFRESFDVAWKEIVEPALKQSYRNGVKAGKEGAGNGEPTQERERSGRRFLKRKPAGEPEGASRDEG